MADIKVMIVDDSALIRRLLTETLTSEPGVTVAGFAVDGEDCIEKIGEVSPDVLVLDIEMPRRNGLETLRVLRDRKFEAPVIMFSTLTERGSQATLDALTFGASDYVSKPSNTGDFMTSISRVRDELVPKIRALHEGRVNRLAPAPMAPPSSLRSSAPATPAAPIAQPAAPVGEANARRPVELRGGGFDAVVIGVSTGGPNALTEFIPKLPADLSVPILIVQHMPASFTPLLAEQLNQKSALSVIEASDGMAIEAGKVYIAPGDYHMTVVRELGRAVLRMNQETPENSCRPAADVLFRTAAKTWGKRLLGVVMTGMGQDGTAGSKVVKELGGQVIVQDQESSVVWSMAGSVFREGLAAAQVPLQDLARVTRDLVQGRMATHLGPKSH